MSWSSQYFLKNYLPFLTLFTAFNIVSLDVDGPLIVPIRFRGILINYLLKLKIVK